jgi:hypothetical protein
MESLPADPPAVALVVQSFLCQEIHSMSQLHRMHRGFIFLVSLRCIQFGNDATLLSLAMFSVF